MTHYEHWREIRASHTDWPWKFFTPEEMSDRSDGSLVVDVAFMDRLDALRRLFGGPLRVLSAYRSPYHNAVVGGAPMSRHLAGDAVDISTVGMEKREALIVLAGDTGFRGFGYYRTFMHFDLGRPRSWGKE